MAKSKLKTTWTKKSVTEFIASVPDTRKQQDSLKLVEIMQELSGFKAEMWGPTIIGFGAYHYVYETGHEGDAPRIGFSPRKAAITLYLCRDSEKMDELLSRFGKHTTSVACIYFKKLDDINMDVLKKMISLSIKMMDKKYK